MKVEHHATYCISATTPNVHGIRTLYVYVHVLYMYVYYTIPCICIRLNEYQFIPQLSVDL